ncbi:hypothetical protein PMAYCL1PPCAC_25041, partial [Pristionchus mayeri]
LILMVGPCEQSDKEIIAELQEQLAKKDSEFDDASNSFRTILGLKNKRIRELEDEIIRLKLAKQEDAKCGRESNEGDAEKHGKVRNRVK